MERLNCYHELRKKIKDPSFNPDKNLKKAGEGGYADVYCGPVDGCDICAKRLPAGSKTSKEIDIHTAATKRVIGGLSPNISLLYGQRRSDNMVSLYVERMEGTLYDWLMDTRNLAEWKSMMYQLWSAIYVFHRRLQIQHNDLSIVNVMYKKISSGGKWKYRIDGNDYTVTNEGWFFGVIDFGSADRMVRLGVNKEYYTNKDIDYYLTILDRLQVIILQELYQSREIEAMLERRGERGYIKKKRKQTTPRPNANEKTRKFLRERYHRALLFKVIEMGMFDELYRKRNDQTKLQYPDQEVTEWLTELSKHSGKNIREVISKLGEKCSADAEQFIATYDLDK